jgi:hypothetical protein
VINLRVPAGTEWIVTLVWLMVVMKLIEIVLVPAIYALGDGSFEDETDVQVEKTV